MSNPAMSPVDRKQAIRLKETTAIEDELLRIATIAIFDYNNKHKTNLMVKPKDGRNYWLSHIKIFKQISLLEGITDKKEMFERYNKEPENPKAYEGFYITKDNFFLKNDLLYLFNGSLWYSKFTGASRDAFADGVFKKKGMCPDLFFYNMETKRSLAFEHKEQQDAGNADERFFRWGDEMEILRSFLNVPENALPYAGAFTGKQVTSPGAARAIINSFDNHTNNYLLIEDVFLDESEQIMYDFFYKSIIPQLVS